MDGATAMMMVEKMEINITIFMTHLIWRNCNGNDGTFIFYAHFDANFFFDNLELSLNCFQRNCIDDTGNGDDTNRDNKDDKDDKMQMRFFNTIISMMALLMMTL